MAIHNDTRFDEALKLLNDAAKEKKGDFTKLISEKYQNIKEALTEVASTNKDIMESVTKTISDNLQEGKEKVSQYTKGIDKSVHQSPWTFIGGVAAGALLLGFILGNSKK